MKRSSHQLRRGQAVEVVDRGHGQDTDDDSKVSKEASGTVGEVSSVLELLETGGDDKGAKEVDDGHEVNLIAVDTTVTLHSRVLQCALAQAEKLDCLAD